MYTDEFRTLALLEGKKISAREALEFLEAMDVFSSGGEKAVSLRVRVCSGARREPVANIRVPLAWAKFLAPFIEGKIAGDLAAKGYILNTDKIQAAVEAGRPASILEVRDGGDSVEIFIE